MSSVKIARTIDIAVIRRSVEEKWRRALQTAILELLDYLEAQSYRGVSEDSESLRKGWTFSLQKIPKSELALAVIRNTAPASLFRVTGRGPGKRPPAAAGTPLANWALSKGLNPYILASAIAARGTQRWRDNNNFLGIDSKTKTLKDDSPIYTVFLPALKREWDKLG